MTLTVTLHWKTYPSPGVMSLHCHAEAKHFGTEVDHVRCRHRQDGPVSFTFKLCWKTDASGRLRSMHCQQPTAHCGGGEGGAGREDQARAGKGCVRDSYIMYRPDSPPLIGERAAERGLKLLCAQLGGCCCRWRVDTEEGGPAVDAPKVVDGKVSAATEHPTSIAPSGRPGADRRTPVTVQHPHTPQGERVRHVGRRRGGHMPYSGKREGGEGGGAASQCRGRMS